MAVKEFWNDEPELLWAYRKSYMDKMKINNELSNYNAWLIGAYVFEGTSKSLYNAFGRSGNKPALNYSNSPYDFSKSKEEIEQEERLKVEEQIRERNREIKRILEKQKGVDKEGWI